MSAAMPRNVTKVETYSRHQRWCPCLCVNVMCIGFDKVEPYPQGMVSYSRG